MPADMGVYRYSVKTVEMEADGTTQVREYLWVTREYGRPNLENLERWFDSHASKKIVWAKLIDGQSEKPLYVWPPPDRE